MPDPSTPAPHVFGTHDEKTLAQLADVGSRAERIAVATRCHSRQSLTIMPHAMAVRASNVTLRDFTLHLGPTQITLGAWGMAEINTLLAAHMIEVHDFGRKTHSAVDAWLVLRGADHRCDARAPLTLIYHRFLPLLRDAIGPLVVFPVVRGSSSLLFRRQIPVALCHAE